MNEVFWETTTGVAGAVLLLIVLFHLGIDLCCWCCGRIARQSLLRARRRQGLGSTH